MNGHCVRISVGGTTMHVMRGGPTLELDGIRFEWSEMFGPQCVGKRGHEIKPPGVKHRWWKALYWWIEQGKRTTDGICVYDEPTLPRERTIHIIGKHYLVVPDDWTQAQIDAKVTSILTAAHRRFEARQSRRRQ